MEKRLFSVLVITICFALNAQFNKQDGESKSVLFRWDATDSESGAQAAMKKCPQACQALNMSWNGAVGPVENIQNKWSTSTCICE